MADIQNLKQKTITGGIWKFGERSIAQIVNFVVSIILARLLLPEDYGLIALVVVFTNICDKLLICGFATSLIQKKDADNTDFSTVFIFSMAAAGVLYALLYFSAPFIASFYSRFDHAQLIAVIRVFGLSLFLVGFQSVQHAYVSNTMQFKRFFWSTLGGNLISGVVGIWMAYSGFGVWALVAQSLTAYFCDNIILWFTVKWRPLLLFSVQRFKSLFSYGWKLFAASIIKVIYKNLRSLVVGKFYNPSDLAFYNKGESFPHLVDSNVLGVIDSVMFPALSKLQDSKESMLAALRRAIKTSSFLMMPLLAGLAAVGHPLIFVLLTDKWLPCVPFLQILCFAFILSPVEVENLQAIKAIGRSDVVLKLEIVKKTVGLLLLICAIPISVKAIAMSMLISQVFSTVVNAWPNKKFIGYSLKDQLIDILPYLLTSLLMYGGLTLFNCFVPIENQLLNLIIQITLGGVFYLGIMKIMGNESLNYVMMTISDAKKQKDKKKQRNNKAL